VRDNDIARVFKKNVKSKYIKDFEVYKDSNDSIYISLIFNDEVLIGELIKLAVSIGVAVDSIVALSIEV
jgi:hypothetical protein